MSEIFPPNKTVFNKNLRQLAKTYPELSQKLQASEMPLNQKVITAKNGSPTLIVTQNEAEISIHSRYNPEREAYRWAEALGEDWDLLILYGLGLGYHLLAVQELYPEKEIILVEQTSNSLFQAMHYLDLTATFNNLYLVIEEMVETAANKVGQLIFLRSNKKQLIRAIPGHENVSSEYWSLLLKRINELLLSFRSNLATEISHESLWVKNFKDNIIDYYRSPGINTLFNCFTGVPIVIVASGPSLAKNIHLLSDVKGKALIIAAGSAIGPLIKRGIIPDLVVSIDPREPNFKSFKNIGETDVKLVFASTIYPRIPAEFKGPKLAFELNTFQLNRWFDAKINNFKGVLASGSTVAVTCFDLAVNLGGNPIIFIGQDLAYTDLKSHAEGNAHFKEISINQKGLFELDGVQGKVYTNEQFLVMKTHLESLIKKVSSKREVIDATEGGVIIEGTKIMAFSDAIGKYCCKQFPIDLTFQQKAVNTNDNLTWEQKNKLLQSIEVLQNDIRIIKDVFNKVKEKVDTFAAATVGFDELHISKIEKEIKKFERQVVGTAFVKYFASSILNSRLKIFSTKAAGYIESSETSKEKAYYLLTGYLNWFEIINQVAVFFEVEILCDLENEIQLKL